MRNKKKKVFVGLSGGVDSAVSAALLKEQGFDVTGVFIKVWQPDFLPCNWREERRDAMRVALALDIPFRFFDFDDEYKRGVADYMISEYKAGRTPNPDVLCNREIKFNAFWKKAKEFGVDYIATGHYARTGSANIGRKTALSSPAGDAHSTPPDMLRESKRTGRPVGLRDAFSSQYSPPYTLLAGSDASKDQSYFLWTLTQEDLAHTIFPIGDLKKEKVRELARKYKLPVAEKKDSQGLCFLGDVDLEEFLSHFVDAESGDVLDTLGEVIGTHRGALFYTNGQRHGFEVTQKDSRAGVYYVVGKDMEANTITVSNKEKEITTLSPKKILLKDVNWVIEPEDGSLEARIRYRGEKLPARLELHGELLAVSFSKSVRGLSLGQSIVFYKEEALLGGAVMDKVLE